MEILFCIQTEWAEYRIWIMIIPTKIEYLMILDSWRKTESHELR